MAAIACFPRNPHRSCHRRTLAHPGDPAEPAVFRFHHAQRAGRISGLLLVLFLQRASAAIFEFKISARLQYRPAPVLLVVPSAVAIPLERVSSGGCEAEL